MVFSQSMIEKMIFKFISVAIIIQFSITSVTFVTSTEEPAQNKSEPLTAEYCSDLKGSMKNGSIESFINTVNIQWKLDGGPQSNEACQELMNQIFIGCDIKTHVKIGLRRPIKIVPKPHKYSKGKAKKDAAKLAAENDNSTTTEAPKGKTTPNATVANVTVPTEDAGTIDIRTVDPSLKNFVIKFRFGKRSSCASLGPLLKMLDVDMFRKMYPPEQEVILLALSFNNKNGDTIKDWIALTAKNEEIVDAQRQAECVEQPEFKDLNYKEKHVLEYFKDDAASKKA